MPTSVVDRGRAHAEWNGRPQVPGFSFGTFRASSLRRRLIGTISVRIGRGSLPPLPVFPSYLEPTWFIPLPFGYS